MIVAVGEEENRGKKWFRKAADAGRLRVDHHRCTAGHAQTAFDGTAFTASVDFEGSRCCRDTAGAEAALLPLEGLLILLLLLETKATGIADRSRILWER